MLLSRFWGNAEEEGRKEGQEFRSLEVRGKLIALKNVSNSALAFKKWSNQKK